MEEFITQVEEYLRDHPEVKSTLERFNISERDYERYIALTSPRPAESSSMNTSEGTYNAEVSGLSV